MKKENGITISKICIILVIIITSATIIVINFIDSYKIYNLKNYIAKMELIQENVNRIRTEYKLWEKYNPNEVGNFYNYLLELGFINASSSSNLYLNEFNQIITDLNGSNVDYWNYNIDSIIANYYYFTPESLYKLLGVKDSNLHVIINFYTGNVISKEGIEDIKIGRKIYRQYDSSIGEKLEINTIYNNTAPKLEIVENRGLTQKVKIYLDSEDNVNIFQIYYLSNKTDEVKKKCSQLTDYEYIKSEKAAYFTIGISGEYEFIVEDTNYIQYSSIHKEFNLCNPPILMDGMNGIYWNGDEEKNITSIYDSNWYNYSYNELKMANAKTEDGNYWVWIPRFLYKESEEGIDLRYTYGNSITPTNNKASTEYKLQTAFQENGEISGFWIAKFQSNSENQIIIKPGCTLAIINTSQAKNNCNSYINNSIMFSKLISNDELNSVIILSKGANKQISNNLIHYSGGGITEYDYIENGKYSSSNNVYGVFDVITSENELLDTSKMNEYGRYRPVLIPK